MLFILILALAYGSPECLLLPCQAKIDPWLRVMEDGQESMRSKDPNSAKEYFNKALAMVPANDMLNPRLSLSLRYLGDSLMELADYEGASRCYRRDIDILSRLSPTFPDISYDYYQLGVANYRQKKFHQSVGLFDKALKIRLLNMALHIPRTNKLMLDLAIAQCLDGDMKGAQSTIELTSSTSRQDLRQLPIDLLEANWAAGEQWEQLGLPVKHPIRTLQELFILKSIELTKNKQDTASKMSTAIAQQALTVLYYQTYQKAKARQLYDQTIRTRLTIKDSAENCEKLIEHTNMAVDDNPMTRTAIEGALRLSKNLSDEDTRKIIMLECYVRLGKYLIVNGQVAEGNKFIQMALPLVTQAGVDRGANDRMNILARVAEWAATVGKTEIVDKCFAVYMPLSKQIPFDQHRKELLAGTWGQVGKAYLESGYIELALPKYLLALSTYGTLKPPAYQPAYDLQLCFCTVRCLQALHKYDRCIPLIKHARLLLDNNVLPDEAGHRRFLDDVMKEAELSKNKKDR